MPMKFGIMTWPTFQKTPIDHFMDQTSHEVVGDWRNEEQHGMYTESVFLKIWNIIQA
jgi:hypothetical protein